MKKVLQVCAIDVSIDALLKPLVKSLMEAGYIVHNACTDTGNFEKLRQEHLLMINIPIDRKISMISNMKSVIKLYNLMKKEKYDLVHVHTPIAAILGRIAAKLAGVKHIIYTAHGFYFHEGMSKKKYLFYYYVEKWFAKYFTDWLLLVSKEDYELCVKNKFRAQKNIIHISNGVDIVNKFNPHAIPENRKHSLVEQFNIKRDDIVYSFIGRLVKEKGIFELVEAFKKLKNETDKKIKLMIIGELPASERDQTSLNLLKRDVTDPDIIVTGYRNDIPELLSISSIFVLPSYREGLPLSIIEAMALGKPIIATNIRGCREEVFPEVNGFLVEKKKADDLFIKMKLLLDEKKRSEFGYNSRKIAENHFDQNKVIKKQIDLYDNLINKQENYETII